ncbi:hypothetical protein SH467x_004065 [Pirellulaceae bacterium SH467]
MLLFAATNLLGQEVATEAPTKDWVYLENNDIKVGVLRSHGGAMAYLSSHGSDDNVLNHYDHGRLVQQSYYGDEDGSKWVKQPWRFNPVQGGDYRGTASNVLEFRTTDREIYTKTAPRHWATGELLEECMMEQTIQLEGPIVRILFAFEYKGETVHAARHQETPAVFVEPRYNRLFYYEGNDAWSGGELKHRIPGWPNESIKLSESWAAYVDDSGQGLGVYVPGCSEATCYRYQGGSGSDCSYIAPLRTFSLRPGLRFTYIAYFTLGTPATIRSRFQAIKPPPAIQQ